eukprot:TRINITY_DN7521_c0_g1_i3.p1 TRINITY_DN7521_c0_g1~~TRINITY_DN7521_c0_g1_i3.p1  ORF type:complete len:230 (+),score=33.97 TRINITY_DN7521_c0_g1_i3:28-717(+)
MTSYHECKPKIGPSILASDLSKLAEACDKAINEWGADYIHVDIMDGHFVPNLTIGPPVVKSLRANTKGFLDCHLMVSEPRKWVEDMAKAGADQFIFHVEAEEDPGSLIDEIIAKGMQPGLVIKPKTPIDAVFPYVDKLNVVLIMTVEPGFGGQSFMEDMMPKVRTLRDRCPGLDIAVDGGLSPKTIDHAAKAGANMIVAGSAVFKAQDPKSVIDTLRKSILVHGNGKSE